LISVEKFTKENIIAAKAFTGINTEGIFLCVGSVASIYNAILQESLDCP